jgi:hypothetical protein
MHAEMIGNFPLGLTVSLHRLFDLFVPSTGDVVGSPGEFNALRPSHAGTISYPKCDAKKIDLTAIF